MLVAPPPPPAADALAYLGTAAEVAKMPLTCFAKYPRAGLIARVHNDGNVALLFPVQKRRNAKQAFICDFGGRRTNRRKPEENPVVTAVREGLEESLGVLAPWLQTPALAAAPVYTQGDTVYLLIEIVDYPPALLCMQFEEALVALATRCRNPRRELCESSMLVYVPVNTIQTAIAQRRWPRFRGYPWSTWLTGSLTEFMPTLLQVAAAPSPSPIN